MMAVWVLRGYAILMNIILFVVMGVDKSKARKGKRRVPEADLFLLAVLGGAIGGMLGMLAFRHKTQHWSFVIGFPVLMLVQIVAAMWLKMFILL